MSGACSVPTTVQLRVQEIRFCGRAFSIIIPSTREIILQQASFEQCSTIMNHQPVFTFQFIIARPNTRRVVFVVFANATAVVEVKLEFKFDG
jgi:hypothetical protein